MSAEYLGVISEALSSIMSRNTQNRETPNIVYSEKWTNLARSMNRRSGIRSLTVAYCRMRSYVSRHRTNGEWRLLSLTGADEASLMWPNDTGNCRGGEARK